MQIEKVNNVYFIGIGGIGMSAVARYFNALDKNIAGYDKTRTKLTDELSGEGMAIHFEDSADHIPELFRNPQETLVIYTPAISDDHKEMAYFRDGGFTIMKRSQALGLITKNNECIAVAGTHGKTTISTFIAYLLNHSTMGISAFLGGISKNFQTNYLFSKTSKFIVVEADEFDRSFLQLEPSIAVISAIDADHLDIYGDKKNIVQSFNQFIKKIKKKGVLLVHKNVNAIIQKNDHITIYTYALYDEADFYLTNIEINDGLYSFTLKSPFGTFSDLLFGFPGEVNLENCLAGMAISLLMGMDPGQIRNVLPGFKGIRRRFDVQINTDNLVYIDDYAHHPEEIKRLLTSVKKLYPGKKISGIFQPHLYSRTRDFADEFAASLSLLDELLLLDIYPAREAPIPGVSSELIYRSVTISDKYLLTSDDILKYIENKTLEVLLTIGAGDIDKSVEKIRSFLMKNL